VRKEREEEIRRHFLEEERKQFEDELKVQRAQSDADSEWLRREERAFSVSNGKTSENADKNTIEEKSTLATTNENEEKNEEFITQELPTPDEAVQSKIVESSLNERKRSVRRSRPLSEAMPQEATIEDSPENNGIIIVDNPTNQPQEDTMEDENKHVNSKTASEVDPSQDQVYVKTTSVVKSIVELNTGVQMTRPEEFVDLVKVVGLNLRDFLASVDAEIENLASSTHKEVEMAHKVLSADMAELINRMKLAQKYSNTTLDQDYKRNMLEAAHALAFDARNLYDTVVKARAVKS